MTINLVHTCLLQGLILSVITLGVMIPFRLLNFPDLSAEGAYPLGGAIFAILISSGVPTTLGIILAMLGSGLVCIATTQIALRMKINSLLAGIILSTMAYTVNLRVLGKPNIALFNYDLFDFGIGSLCIIILACVIPLNLFLYTDFGLRLRAVGLNQKFAVKQNISINKYTTLGMFVSGCMYGLAASIMVQTQQYMEVGMGIGIVMHALASLMIGESIIGNNTLTKQIAAPIFGSIVYQQIQGLALSCGLLSSDLKFFTGSIVLLMLRLKRKKHEYN